MVGKSLSHYKIEAELHHPHIASVFEIDAAVPEGFKGDDIGIASRETPSQIVVDSRYPNIVNH